jgi:hypothetical protein
MSAAKTKGNPAYPPRILEFSRRLYADGEGHSISAIRMALAKRGYTPSHSTILCWVDDEYREERLRRQRRYRPPGPAHRRGWQWRLERMKELREEVNLSTASIARLMSHDFNGVKLTRHQVETILTGKVSTKTARRLLYPQGMRS